MNEIEKLKLVRVPLWARLLGAWRHRIELKARLSKKRYVTTVFHWTWIVNRGHWVQSWWICFEDGYRRRTFEFGASGPLSRPERDGRSANTYAHVIAPWIAGYYSNEQLCEYAGRSRTAPIKPETQGDKG